MLKLWISSGHTASFKIEISKVQDFGKFELSPMTLFCETALHLVQIASYDRDMGTLNLLYYG